MAETRGGNERPDSERAPAAPELLRAAMEKVVFFEWRLGEMAAELAAAQARAEAAEIERARLAEQRSEAERETEAARRRAHELEAERQRLSSLVVRPAHAAAEHTAAQAERVRSAELAASLAEARREIERQRAERDRWLDERLSHALGAGDSEASLAAFISELRAEVISLRERQRQCDELLEKAGIAPPASWSPPEPLVPAPRHDTVEAARAFWSQGRLGANPDPALAARAEAVPPAPAAPPIRTGAAASALADQCLRGLSARDPARREQAARHLAAMPVAAAAPALASALGGETDPRARGQIALALVACGGGAGADLVAGLQSDPEPLVRLSALDALCSLADRAPDALRAAARDDSVAVRRRAAAIAASLSREEIRARFAMDAEGSVRAASAVRELPEPPKPPPTAPAAEAAPGGGRAAPVRAVPAPSDRSARDLASDALLAVQTAIFGLTETELAESLSLPASAISPLVASLVSAGRLTRRGKRLVAAAGPGAAAQGGP